MLNILKSIQKQMKQDSEQFKLRFTFLNQSMSKVESSLTAVVARLTVLEDENNKFREECEELKIKNATLVRRVNEHEDSVIEQEQYSRVANLEIRGVPQTDKEDVDRRFRSAIVVQFARRSVRGEWLAATKTRFHATDLHETFSPGPVFVNKHPTHQGPVMALQD
ncbi:hypothetical protein J6590_098798 [Homalodisca vitripennis]|nr:hypothetical protein J6590_098798 [Homalodisca vitripennis]